jgi:hypothetical protein
LPDEAKKILGSTNNSYYKYFGMNFPGIMLAVDEFIQKNLLSDPLFAQYYSN